VITRGRKGVESGCANNADDERFANECQLISSFRESSEPRTWYVRRRVRWGLWRARRPIWRLKARIKRRMGVSPRDTSQDVLPLRIPIAPLDDLKEGDLIRVRSLAEIQSTLDEKSRCHGCSFLWPMRQFCGREFRVAKRVRHFFDENRWRMVRCGSIALLEGVYCDGSFGHPDTRGCDRLCFLFWRTEWLERVESTNSASPAPEQA